MRKVMHTKDQEFVNYRPMTGAYIPLVKLYILLTSVLHKIPVLV